MIFWILTLVLTASCVLAATLSGFRQVVLSAWCAQLAFGGLALQMGSSYLGLLVWILGSLGTVVLLAYGSVFGELFHSASISEASDAPSGFEASGRWRSVLLPAGGVIASLFFSGLVLFAVQQGVDVSAQTGTGGAAATRGELLELGTYLASDPMISVFSLGVLFLVALFGVGVVTRPRRMRRAGDMTYGRESP